MRSLHLHLAATLQTKAGCALELFPVRPDAFPETLDEALAEASVPTPIDPCDGQPLRYRKTGSGYRIWCGRGPKGRWRTARPESQSATERGLGV